ncbi:GNAT family N-acetyltransferase [Massilia aerilata]|uniref:GNAT family N-acetyltransferase n=1 Tax=Massilia aerilata TaxID=453817 RepID=A0ABW0RU03_9BURK
MDQDYSCHLETPSVDDYLRLRRNAGLTPRSAAAAEAGLPNTVAGVVIKSGDLAVGMGRAVGDGLFYQLVDIAVEPAHQGKGLGKTIVSRLLEALRRIAPAEAYVSLIADGRANELYAQYGFEPTAPASIGMAQWLKP